ncbi:MAG: EAL domain-containing protein [Gammaproteobacteria bacterium]
MGDLFINAGIAVIAIAGVLVWQARRKKPVNPGYRRVLDDNRLYSLVEGISASIGETFFYSLARELSQFLEIDAVFLASRHDQNVYHTQAFWCDGSYIKSQTFSLLNSPCDDIAGLTYLETSASELYPNSALLKERFEVQGFFAIKLLDSSGDPIGLLAGMHRSALRLDNNCIDIIKMFATRSAAELERKLATSEAVIEKERAQVTLHSMGDGVITTDNVGRIDYMNPVAETLTGWRYHQGMGMSLEAVFHLEDEITGKAIPDPALRCLAEKRVIAPKTDNVLVSRQGEHYSIQGTAAPMLNSQGVCTGVVLVFKDVTDSRRLQKMMVHQATHDPLTGLANRSEFETRLDKALQSAKEFENTHALLYLDLDRFKVVNDSAGHAAGDELLKQISSLLSSQLRGRDTLGRLGGDEFSVLLSNCPPTKAMKVAGILIDAIRNYRFVWEGKTYQVGVSIGVVSIGADSGSKIDLMNQADQACYSAKDLGRGRAHVYTEKDAELARRRGEFLQVSEIRAAIDEERLEFLYQPIVPLGSGENGLHTRAEILLRMIDKDGNCLLPGAFLPAADRYGLSEVVDRWVIGKILSEYPYIFMQNPASVLSVNLSANSVADESLADYIIQQFDKTLVKPEQICFEISETAFTNTLSRASRLIGRLRALGCLIAIDDFGSGYTTFSMLKNLDVDFIKIDGAVVQNICDDAIDYAMADSINSMAHILGIKTVAEFADSEATIQTLKILGVDYAQGFYLGEPVPLDEITGADTHSLTFSDMPVS